MDALSESLARLTISPTVQASILVLLALWLWRQARSPRVERLDGTAALHDLTHIDAVAGEEGRDLILTIGRGGAAGSQAADSIAAIALTRQAATSGVLSPASDDSDRHRPGLPPGPHYRVVAGDATLWLAVYLQHPAAADFVGPDAATFAAGVRNILADQPFAAATRPRQPSQRPPADDAFPAQVVPSATLTVPCGAFGDEYLLFAEQRAWHEAGWPAAASTPTLLPFLLATSIQPVLGAELYEAGAYLESGPSANWLAVSRLGLIMAAVIVILAAIQFLLT